MSAFETSTTTDVNTTDKSPVTVSVTITSPSTSEINTISPITVSLNTPATVSLNTPATDSLNDNIRAPSIAPSNHSHKLKCKNDLNMKKKLIYTLYAVILFIVISLPETYEKTNELLKDILKFNTLGDKGPTVNGILVHSIVFGLLIYLLMILLH